MNDSQMFKEVCENDFEFYVKHFLKVLEPETEFEWNWHMSLLCHHCEKVFYGEISNLDINIPPRMLKSVIVSVLFPTWVWIKDPSFKIIGASSTNALAKLFNIKRREIIESDAYQFYWPIKIKDYMNTVNKFENTDNGFMQSVSVGSSIIGQGADCFDGQTEIATNIGNVNIKYIHELADLSLVKVLSYNHETRKIEYKKILGTRKTKSDKVVRTTFDNGRKITSTCDHKFYVEGRGYRKIQDAYNEKDSRFVSIMQCEEDKTSLLQRVCLLGQKIYSGILVQFMQNLKTRRSSRLQEEGRKWNEKLLLFFKMFSKTYEYAVRDIKQVQFVWNEYKKGIQKGSEEKQNLSELQTRRSTLKETFMQDRVLHGMQESISSLIQIKVLLKKMYNICAFERYAWCTESKSQKNKASTNGYSSLFQKTSGYIKRKSEKLCAVRFFRVSSCSSHRLELQEQHNGKFGSYLPILPHLTSQNERYEVNRNTKATFQERVEETIDVYDIEVEGNNNFFANGILVHNCLLSDDLIDPTDAFSATVRDATTFWYSNTFYGRVQNKVNAKRININQRLHRKDVSGFIAETYKFDTLIIPMQKMEKNTGTVHWEDPREVGEFIQPSRFGQQQKDDEYKGLGVYGWSSQYQQSPIPVGGGIVKDEWIRRYSILPKLDRIIITADLAFKKGANTDFVCFQCWGKGGKNKYLIDVVRGRWSYKETKEKFKEFVLKHNNSTSKFIEDKANGPALVDDLKSEVNGILSWPQPSKQNLSKLDKVQRLHMVSQEYENGLVWLPEGIQLVELFVLELTSFTEKGSTTGNDDMVDTSTMALIELKESSTFFAG